MDVSSEALSGTFHCSPGGDWKREKPEPPLPPAPKSKCLVLLSPLTFAGATRLVSGPAPRSAPRNLVSFDSCPAKATANVLWPPAPGRKGGTRRAGGQLYFGEVGTLGGPSPRLSRRPQEGGAGPIRASAAPGARGAAGAEGADREPAACSPLSIDIGVTQRVSFPMGSPGWGRGGCPSHRLLSFPARAPGRWGAASPPSHPARLTLPSREPGRGLGTVHPAASGGGGGDRSPDQRLTGSRESRARLRPPPPRSGSPPPSPRRPPRTPPRSTGLGTHLPRPLP